MLEQNYEEVPWTIQQTLVGILLTLIPWILLALVLSNLVTKSSRSVPLSPTLDMVNAIISFIFSVLVEGAFLIAPFYYANRAASSGISDVPRRTLIWRYLGFRRFNVGSALSLIVLGFIAIYVTNDL